MKLISEEELRQLLIDSKMLNILENDRDVTFIIDYIEKNDSDYKNYKKKFVDYDLTDYPDYIVRESDNYNYD